jgi:hypothetical protein
MKAPRLNNMREIDAVRWPLEAGKRVCALSYSNLQLTLSSFYLDRSVAFQLEEVVLSDWLGKLGENQIQRARSPRGENHAKHANTTSHISPKKNPVAMCPQPSATSKPHPMWPTQDGRKDSTSYRRSMENAPWSTKPPLSSNERETNQYMRGGLGRSNIEERQSASLEPMSSIAPTLWGLSQSWTNLQISERTLTHHNHARSQLCCKSFYKLCYLIILYNPLFGYFLDRMLWYLC